MFMRYLLPIFAKAPFSIVISSSVSYGGLACRHRAFRLYLFAAAALFRRCFSASAPKTADAFSSSKKDTASITVRKQAFPIYVAYRRNWLWGSVYLNSYPLACSIVLISLFPSPFNIQMKYIFINIYKV